MAIYQLIGKTVLSGSTDGRNIKITQTATPGDEIHTAQVGVADMEEVFFYAVNRHTASVTFTVEWGGVASPDDLITIDMEPNKIYHFAPGGLIRNALVIRGFASVTNVINVCFGYTHRYST